MKKLVSVIIPSYNHDKYINECVMSVLNQTYKNIEVYVMDDCSTDNSVNVLKKIKDYRLKVLYSKKNKGTVRTINELMKKCNGEYIAIIGSDDIWETDKIEKQVKVLENNKKIGAVFSSAEIIDENNRIYTDDDAFNHEIFRNENMKSSKRMRLFFEIGNHLCHSSSLIRKSVINKIGDYDITYRQLHDYDYWVRLINEYDIYIINEKLLKYRRFKKSKKNLSNNTCESMIRVVNENNSIIGWMIKNIKDKLFIEAFNDLFVNKNSSTTEELICEKYFLLMKYEFMGVVNMQLALSLVYEYHDKDKLFKTFEKKYNYYLKDFYKDSGKTYDVFNYNIINDCNSAVGKAINCSNEIIEKQSNIINFYSDKINILETNLNMLKKSLSWKITKPLRKIKGLIKK